jgi:hypothetical protein
MNTLFVDLIAVVLLLAGPIAGYHVAMRQGAATRWLVAVWSAAGGAVAANVYFGVLLLVRVMTHAPRSSLSPAAASIVWWALFGLVLGLAGLVPRPAGTPRLVVTGLVMIGVVAVIRLAVDAAEQSRRAKRGASGVVIGPGGAPVAGLPVFLDRGSGSIERLTTDGRGVFHVPGGQTGAARSLLLICVPGGAPYVAPFDEHLLTQMRYAISPLPRGAAVGPAWIRTLGWRQPAPRECVSSSEGQ